MNKNNILFSLTVLILFNSIFSQLLFSKSDDSLLKEINNIFSKEIDSINNENKLLRKSVLDDNINGVQSALAKGAKVNLKDEKGKTVLFYAINNYEIAKLLIAYGADVNVKNDEGETLLFYTKGNYELTKLLIASGIDVNVVNKYDHSALYFAKLNKYGRIVNLLLSHGANITVKLTLFQKIARIIFVTIFASIVLLSLALSIYTYMIFKNSRRVIGTVVKFQMRISHTDNSSRRFYYPIIEYKDIGEKKTWEAGFNYSTKVGNKFNLIISEENGSIAIDSIWGKYGTQILMFVIGFSFLFFFYISII